MSIKKQTKKKTGFTIIEVVLVLAIAGLIFLMVFVALPTLQKSQKDTQRRNDMARVGAALTSYLANNGELPTNSNSSAFIENYLGGNDFKDPNGQNYTIRFEKWNTADEEDETYGKANNTYNNSTNDYKIYIWTHAKCDGDHAVRGSADGEFAVTYKLEGSGSYCVDNG